MSDVAGVEGKWGIAQTIAGKAVLLEIGAQLGILDQLLSEREFSAAEVAGKSGVSESLVSAYYSALVHGGLACAAGSNGATTYCAASDRQESINEAGYVLWGAMSCAPLIANARAFSQDLRSSILAHPRDGAHVARTSRWMGERDFYPQAEDAIVSAQPRKIVDLGSGTCGLLIRCLKKLPDARGIGIDLNHDACEKAKSIIKNAEMDDRISVIEASIQSLIDDPSPLAGVDIIHGGFVFHDLMPDEEATLDALLKTFRRTAASGMLVIVDAVPYGACQGEKAFSAAFTFLHSHFMARQLLTEAEWRAKLSAAGYNSTEVTHLGISGGRIFKARSVGDPVT